MSAVTALGLGKTMEKKLHSVGIHSAEDLEPVFTAENGVWTVLFQSGRRQKCSESTKDSSAFFLGGLKNSSPIPHSRL